MRTYLVNTTLALLALLSTRPSTQPAPAAAVIPADRAVVLDRHVGQLGGRWTIRWRLRWRGPGDLLLDPNRLALDYQAVVSNPECPGHGLPRPSRARLGLAGPDAAESSSDVIASKNPNLRCRERLTWSVALDGGPTVRPGATPVRVPVGGVVVVRLNLVHDHPVYGHWLALLGRRDIEVNLGPLRLGDRVDLRRVLDHTVPPSTWTPPKPVWRDTLTYHSPPHSWGVFPGKDARNTLTLTDIPVRFSTRYELAFWARVDVDKGSRFDVRVQQMQAAPHHYKNMPGTHAVTLPRDDRWHPHRLVWTNGPHTNRVMIQFKFVGATFGGAWIDDLQLRPLPPPRRAP